MKKYNFSGKYTLITWFNINQIINDRESEGSINTINVYNLDIEISQPFNSIIQTLTIMTNF